MYLMRQLSREMHSGAKKKPPLGSCLLQSPPATASSPGWSRPRARPDVLGEEGPARGSRPKAGCIATQPVGAAARRPQRSRPALGRRTAKDTHPLLQHFHPRVVQELPILNVGSAVPLHDAGTRLIAADTHNLPLGPALEGRRTCAAKRAAGVRRPARARAEPPAGPADGPTPVLIGPAEELVPDVEPVLPPNPLEGVDPLPFSPPTRPLWPPKPGADRRRLPRDRTQAALRKPFQRLAERTPSPRSSARPGESAESRRPSAGPCTAAAGSAAAGWRRWSRTPCPVEPSSCSTEFGYA